MGTIVPLANSDGTVERYRMRTDAPALIERAPAPTSRCALAAAHVVAKSLGGSDSSAIDWDCTMAYRHHLWDLGLGVAEAMDTAQRGMGLPPKAVDELIRRSTAAAAQRGALVACGAATDALDNGVGLADIIDEYVRQVDLIESGGGQVVLMASAQLAAAAHNSGDYRRVYGSVLRRVHRPAILHWLGPAFDPRLGGYWGGKTVEASAGSLLNIIEENRDSIDGVKISLLDAQAEINLRRRLPAGVRMYTGDDFNYLDLIRGDALGHSDALLGIFDAIAPLAAAALAALDVGDAGRFEDILKPTVPLSKKLFESPTYHYKTGIVFLAYLTGHQHHFRMLGGFESARSIDHLCEVFRLADQAGLLPDCDQAAGRMRPLLELSGVT